MNPFQAWLANLPVQPECHFRCLICGFQELQIEFVDLIVIMSGCRCMNQHDSDNEITAFKRIEISLLETGRQPKTAFIY